MTDRPADQLRRDLQQDVSEAAASHDRYLTQLTARSSGGARAERPFGAEARGSAENPALAVLTDLAQPPKARLEVMERLGPELARDDDAIRVLLDIVRDAGDDTRVRQAGLALLASAAFQVLRFRPFERDYEAALRGLVTDPDPGLREVAVDTLAVRRDPEVQQVLAAGLRGDGELPVSRDRAIQLLAQDDHLDNLPLLNELYGSDSAHARQEAVRLMGSYPEAREKLEDIARDKDESTEVRQQSAASLRNLAPERFEEVAKEIATDASDHPEMRTASLKTLEHLVDPGRVHGDSDFIGRLEDVGVDESNPALARHARRLLERRPEER